MNTRTLSGMDFASFSTYRQAWLAAPDRPVHALDAGATQLYRALSMFDPERFGPIAPSRDPKSPYRCHLAEAFLDHLSFPHAFKARALVSQGVRSSLAHIFKHLATTRTHQMVIPGDVYPVYATLAAEAGLQPRVYPAREGLPWKDLEQCNKWCLLVCDPLKPWGGRLNTPDLDRLVELASSTQSIVLIDGAYDLDPSPALRAHLAADAPIAFLGSLSKGWLAPLRGGIVLTSQSFANDWRPVFQSASKNELLTREAYACLCDDPDRPGKVMEAIDRSRARLLVELATRGVQAKDPGHGYFVMSMQAPEELLATGILGVPASVFGSSQPGTVLSSIACL